ncbi:hypothetical protein JJQ32_06830 [Enterobacter hormaechei]|nr:hypothetical protein [Enterobacter hormaechei]
MNKISLRILLTLVGLLLILSLLILTYALFSGLGKMEIGSISDWFSAIGTLGTLAVAVAAFRKAPDWMAQKHYDIVYGLIEKAVYKDLSQVKSSNIILRTLLITLCRNLNRFLMDRKPESEIISDMTNRMESVLEEFFNNSYLVINQLNSITRNDYKFSAYAQDILDKLKNISNQYHQIYMDYLVTRAEIGSLLEADQQAIDITSQEIKEIENRALQVGSELDSYIKQIFDKNSPIRDFIVR